VPHHSIELGRADADRVGEPQKSLFQLKIVSLDAEGLIEEVSECSGAKDVNVEDGNVVGVEPVTCNPRGGFESDTGQLSQPVTQGSATRQWRLLR